MTPEEKQDYVAQRAGKYGMIIDGVEELYTIKPETSTYRYDENYVLEIRGKR